MAARCYDAHVPGRANWHGSGFHADVVTERVLSDLIAIRDAERARLPAPTTPEYWIEHAADTTGPDWDVVEHRGQVRILEELKSGKVSAPERRAMWIRVRRTVSSGTAVQDVVVRLTADPNTIKLKSAWAGLSAVTSFPKTSPERPPRKAGSAERFHQEALAYLTHQDLQFQGAKRRKKKRGATIDVGKPLSLADAIGVLQRFEFVANRSRDEVQAGITAALGSLRSRSTVTVLQSWLLGHFFSVAQHSGSIQASKLASALPLIQSVLNLEPDLDRLLDRVLETIPVRSAMKNLKLRDWRFAQPEAADAIDTLASSSAGFVVLTGEAGIGKSTLLVEVFHELKDRGHDVAWLALGSHDGPPPTRAQLDQLTHVLAQRSAWVGRPCWLLVDGIDGLPESLHSLAPQGSLRVVVGARTETYERRRQFSATQIALARWPAGDVESIIGAALPRDLATLLGNPFLLNLALEIPSAQLKRPSRFAVLTRYLSGVVFVAGVDGVDARAAFDVMARGLAHGERWTIPPTAGLKSLIDRSVADAPGGGRVQFAHPLFGEFAVAAWASHRTADLVVRRLSRIDDSFTRGSALRMLLEGCVDVVDSSRLLDLPTVSSLISLALDNKIDIIGALASLDTAIPSVMLHDRAPEFCREMFEAARVSDQRSWLRALPMLDVSPAPSWATAKKRDDALPLIAEHLLACADEIEEETGGQVALRLREWSRGQQSIWASYLVSAIARFLPDDETLRWMQSLMTTDAPWYGAWLRMGLRCLCSRGKNLDEALIRDVLSRVVSLGVTSGLERFEDAHNLLLADRGERGLLQTQPAIALDLLFDWHEHEVASKRNDLKRWREELSGLEQMEPTIEDDDGE
jgi:hypothetical protein